MIYLDYNATTPLDKEASAAMLSCMNGKGWGNPSSSHKIGLEAKAVVEEARAQVAQFLGCSPGEVIFTSGGTESNNHVLKGVACALEKKGKHIISSQIEHPSILQPAIFLLEKGWDVTFLPVDGTGRVDPDEVQRAIRKDTVLISIMHANNETGTIQPISEIASIARRYGIYFHSDAAQSAGKIDTLVQSLGIDFLSIAGHKLYGPKGIGALYIREGASIESLLHGAGQERGRRAGTENVFLAVGLGMACSVSGRNIGAEAERQRNLRDLLFQIICSQLSDVVLNGHPEHRLPNTLNLSFPGLSGGDILASMPSLCASTGAACHDRSVTLSHVLAAMGVPKEVGMGAIRLTLGRFTTKEEVLEAASLIAGSVRKAGLK